MENKIKIAILGLFIFFSTDVYSVDSLNPSDIDEMIIEEDPYVGITIDLEKFPPMVYMSNLTNDLYPSKYVQNIDRLITSLARSKKAERKFFKESKKKLKFLAKNNKFKVSQVLKTAVYKNNEPDEYTTYILKDSEGKLYAIPEFELKEISKIKLDVYEKILIEEASKQGEKARVVLYFQKPDIYKDKKPPFKKKELDSVFEFFFSNISGYSYENVYKSERNFRMSMDMSLDALAFIISEIDNLYIEDLEIIPK